MKIKQINIYKITLPLKDKCVTSHSVRTKQSSVTVEILTDEGIYGMGNVSPSPGYSSESVDEIADCIRYKLAPSLIDKEPLALNNCLEEFETRIKGQQYAKAALEMALWDIVGKELKRPVYQLLGGFNNVPIPLIGWIGHSSVDDTVKQAQQWLTEGFTTLKIKIGKNVKEDIERIKAVREIAGDDIQLRVDANEGYTTEEAIEANKGFIKYAIAYCEQPVIRSDWEGMARIKKTVNVPIMADESISEPNDIITAAQTKGADIVKLKVMKCGGLLNTCRMIWLAKALGFKCVFGHGFTFGVDALAEYHVATAMNNLLLLPVETTGILKISDDIIKSPIKVTNGQIRLDKTPGLGATLDQLKLRQYMTSKQSVNKAD